jgi:hypothetical protein
MMGDLTPLPLSDKKRAYWWAEIKKSRQKREAVAEKHGWQDNLERYEPQAKKRGRKSADINTGVDFADVESKKAALLFTTPTVALTECADGLQQAVAIHAELLNTILGPEHANVLPVAQRAIFNCLCPSGIGPVVLGYSCTKQIIEQEMIAVDPMTGQPALDPLTGMPQTQLQKVPVPIAEKFFVSDLSPKSLLLPANLRTTDYQGKASWIGYEWQKPVSQVRSEFSLKEDWKPSGSATEGEKIHFDHGDDQSDDEAGDPMVSGVTLWYRAELDAKPGQAKHPDQLRKLTMIEGEKDPLEHWDSQDQTLDEAGRLTPDSLLGFNVRPLVLRDLSDSAWIPSDSAITGGLTKEQHRYREISLRKRDTTVSIIAYDPAKLPVEQLNKARKEAGNGGVIWVPVPDLAGGAQTTAVELVKPSQGRETYLDQDLIRQDRDRVLATGNNQVGVKDKQAKTATETSIVQRNTDARFEQERQRVERWYLYDIVKPLDALVLRYCDERLAAQILGPQKAALWAQFKPALAGGYRYTLQMDSGKYLDVESKRRQTLQLYNMLAKDPMVNRGFLLSKVAEDFGFDPTKFLAQPQPDKPEPPKMSVASSAADFVLPQGAILLDLLAKMGYPIDPEAIKTALAMQAMMPPAAPGSEGTAPSAGPSGQPPHGGAAEKAERIDQHQMDETGGLSGPGPM